MRSFALAALSMIMFLMPQNVIAQEIEPEGEPSLFSAMEWRSIGPYRGGRSVANAGVPSEPRTYYMGTVGGGIWKLSLIHI